MNTAFRDYANLTEEQKGAIIDEYYRAREMGCPPDQSIAIGAVNGLRLTARQWNAKTGANAFAAACAVLIMRKVIDVRRPINGIIA